ncbi:unnamed protein product, partial [Mycena citricolor]
SPEINRSRALKDLNGFVSELVKVVARDHSDPIQTTMISDTAAIFLAVALFLSNVERLIYVFHWIWVSVGQLCGRPSRQAVPYWSRQ